MKIFYSRAMDGLSFDKIKSDSKEVEKLLEKIGFVLVNPFQGKRKVFSKIENRAPRQVVDRDLSELEKCEVFLMDCTISDRNYVGSLCEMMYAYFTKKYIIVYTGDTAYEKRYWLSYHANYTCKTLNEAIDHLIKMKNENR